MAGASSPRHRACCAAVLLSFFLHSVSPLSSPAPLGSQLVQSSSVPQSSSVVKQAPGLSGDWASAKLALRDPNCCVVSVKGLEPHLRVLQDHWAAQPEDVDLRMRVRAQATTPPPQLLDQYDQRSQGASSTRADCLKVLRGVSPHLVSGGLPLGSGGGASSSSSSCSEEAGHIVAALEELARGVVSMADGPLEGACEDVHIRVVCASDYQAKDPAFHTDKCPLRGYVTLKGVGTEFMTRVCSPVEYVSLRSLGVASGGGESASAEPAKSLRQAQELEFIVMKGDYYNAKPPATALASSAISTNAAAWLLGSMASSMASSMAAGLWQRSQACVHRSPPTLAASSGELLPSRRRVILSLDLADGDDDREWYVADTKKKWRSGMTQRKGPLVQ